MGAQLFQNDRVSKNISHVLPTRYLIGFILIVVPFFIQLVRNELFPVQPF